MSVTMSVVLLQKIAVRTNVIDQLIDAVKLDEVGNISTSTALASLCVRARNGYLKSDNL